MKAKPLYLVILLAIIFTACAQSASQVKPSGVSTSTAAPAKNPESKQPPKSVFQPTQAWSNAPLSSGILLSRYDNRKNKAEIFAIDPQSGLPIASAQPIPAGRNFSNVRSPDGSTLAVVAYPSAETAKNGRLHFIDLAAWQDSSLDFDIDGWVGVLTYSVDGRYLAIITWDMGSDIYLVDVQAKGLVGHTRLKNKFAKAQFTRDGSGLMVYMSRWDSTKDPEVPPSAARLVVPGLEVQWEQALDGINHGFFVIDPKKDPHQPGAGLNFEPGVAFSTVEDKVYVLHADSARLTSVDFDRQDVSTVEIAPKMSWLERLLRLDAKTAYAKVLDGTIKKAVVSQDGKTIYVTGVTHKFSEMKNNESELITTPLGLQVIDAQTGTELAKYDTNAEALNLSPDGRWVFLYSYRDVKNYSMPMTQVFDLQAGAMKTTMDGYLSSAYSMNGEMFYVSETNLAGDQQRLGIFDAQSFQEIINLASDQSLYLSWLVGPLY